MGTEIFNISAKAASDIISNFTCLGKGPKYMKSFCFGTVHTHTKDNLPVGVHRGRYVRLNLIIIESSFGMTKVEPVAYSELVGEIVNAMANDHAAMKELLSFF